MEGSEPNPGNTSWSSQMPDSDVGVRRLTPLECERIQGFPDRWTDVDEQADQHRYRQMGNAVPVPVVEWIAHRIVAVEAGRW